MEYLYTTDEMPEGLKILYSRNKMGDRRAIEFFATALARRIREVIEGNEWSLVSCPTDIPHKNVYYMGNMIAEQLGMPRIHISRKTYEECASLYNGGLYVEVGEEKRLALARAMHYYEGEPLTGKKIVFIDDCVTTGGMYESCREILDENGAKEIRPFFAVKVLGDPATVEKDLDLLAIEKGGLQVFCDIVNDPDNIIVSWGAKSLIIYSEDDLSFIARSLRPERLHELQKTILMYYGKCPESLLPLFHGRSPRSSEDHV
ncbi:MAG: phosphoribosyltransferase [Candidatus Peribacteraceae bacterium]|nr:phosphoribosyltransferase [Candidatus Peribacteraceae bacterium]